MKTLGDRLRNARERKNLSQIEASKCSGINNKTISNYENNVSSPDPDTLIIFADLYETSVDYLLGRTEIINEQKNETKAYHNFDVAGLPEEAIRQIEDYIELIKLKYYPDGMKKK